MAVHAGTIVGIVLIVILVIYALVIYWAHKNKTFIFAPYEPPPLQNGFQPAGQVVPLTPQEIQCRQQAIGTSGTGLPPSSCWQSSNS